VAALRDRGYVVLTAASHDAREKIIELTPLARDYLAAQRAAARSVAEAVEQQVGPAAFEGFTAVMDALGAGADQPRMGDYLRHAVRFADDAGGQ
jgi:DNA-binding MarR family transcriptional regulator